LTIVAPSRWLASVAKESFLREYPITMINNGIDLGHFAPTPSDFRSRYSLENKVIVLGVAARWTDRKGFNLFIDLAKQLGPDERIVLVGANKFQQGQLPKNVIGISKTNDTAELVRIYSAADVFVNPTLEEVLGLVNLEALACG
jgi:putative colanic acid biosynthesis glycosyltransferase